MAGHWCCTLAKHGWQQLPPCVQRVTLGDVLFWGTLCLCLQRRLEGWADLILRGADVFWVNTWCKTKTGATNTGQPSGGDPIVSPLLLNRHEKGEPSLCVPELQGVSWMHRTRPGQALRAAHRSLPLTWYQTCHYLPILFHHTGLLWSRLSSNHKVGGLIHNSSLTNVKMSLGKIPSPKLLLMVRPSVCECVNGWDHWKDLWTKAPLSCSLSPFNITIMLIHTEKLHSWTRMGQYGPYHNKTIRIENSFWKLIMCIFHCVTIYVIKKEENTRKCLHHLNCKWCAVLARSPLEKRFRSQRTSCINLKIKNKK